MEGKGRTGSPLLFNSQGEALYCTHCDVFPQMHSYLAQRSCLCTTILVSVPFPDYWMWINADEGN